MRPCKMLARFSVFGYDARRLRSGAVVQVVHHLEARLRLQLRNAGYPRRFIQSITRSRNYSQTKLPG